MNQIAFEHQQPGFPDPFPVAQVAKSIELDAKHVFEFAVPASEKLSISNAYIISNELADSEVKVEAWLEGQLVYSKAFMINSSEIKILGFGMNSIVDRFRITSDNEYLVQQFNYQNNSFENSQSRCIGEACEEGEVFLFDALRLKEDNIRLHFQSSLYSDWRILINDIEENGENYFAVEDSDRNIVPFKLMAGAKEDSLVVTPTGVGVGLAEPSAELEVSGTIKAKDVVSGETSLKDLSKRVDQLNRSFMRTKIYKTTPEEPRTEMLPNSQNRVCTLIRAKGNCFIKNLEGTHTLVGDNCKARCLEY